MFSSAIKLATRSNRVYLAYLCEMQFETATMYYHNGGGLLASRGADGEIEEILWKGLQGLASVSGLGGSRVGQSKQVTCTLNMESAQIKEWFFEAEQRAVKNRKFRFWGQFYDVDNQPIDPKFHIYTGIGDRLRMNKSGPRTRRIELLLEDRITRRRRSANSMVTHSDQQLRDPASTGFIYVQKMLDQSLNLFETNN